MNNTNYLELLSGNILIKNLFKSKKDCLSLE